MDIDSLIQNSAFPREVLIVDIKRALDNYTWEAWSDGVMRTSPLIERWAMLCLDMKKRGPAGGFA